MNDPLELPDDWEERAGAALKGIGFQEYAWHATYKAAWSECARRASERDQVSVILLEELRRRLEDVEERLQAQDNAIIGFKGEQMSLSQEDFNKAVGLQFEIERLQKAFELISDQLCARETSIRIKDALITELADTLSHYIDDQSENKLIQRGREATK